MMTTITREQADRLAALLHTLRPDWDAAGVVKALGDARGRGDAWAISHAALHAAQERRNRTPAVIALAGEHWTKGHALGEGTTVPMPGQARCDIDGHENELENACRICRAEEIGISQPMTRHTPNDNDDAPSTGYRNTIRAMQLAGIPLTDRQRAALDTEETK